MTRLLTFDVYRSRFPRSELGEQLESVQAPTHREAKELAARANPGLHVVVILRPGRAP